MNGIAAAIIEGLIYAATEIARAVRRESPDTWDSLRGRLASHAIELDTLLRDAEDDLAGWERASKE